MHSFLEYLSVILISTIKVGLGGIPLSIALGFDTKTIILLNIIGGSIGVFFFVYLSNWLNEKLNTYFKKKSNQRKFTRTNRFIIKVKTHGGIYGLCLITPLFFSFPLGCFVTVRYFKNKQKIIVIMLISVIFWSTILGSLGGLV
jgi:hypothetical protein